MKKYTEYMDGIRASDTLHQRLLGLEASGKRPIPWKRYGAMAAALALVLGLGGYGLSRGGWEALAENFRPDAQPEIEPAGPVSIPEGGEVEPDIALVEPSDVDMTGMKTLGGYEVSGGELTTYYVLPYIEYGDTYGAETAMDWDIPAGAVKRDLTEDEIVTLMGGVGAVDIHLDWSKYDLYGWAAWCEDGSFWGTYIYGRHTEWSDTFEFAVTVGQLPPTCIVYPNSVTQEIRGITVTADKYDWELGEESLTRIPQRRVSFFKDDCGYRFAMASGDTSLAEEMVSRLVCHIADRGLGLDVTETFAVGRPYTCSLCGEEIAWGTNHLHSHPAVVGEPNWNDGGGDCPYCADGTPHTHPYDPHEGADPSYSAPATYVCETCGETVPVDGMRAHVHSFHPETDPDAMCSGYPVPCPNCGAAVPEGMDHDCVVITCPDCGETYDVGGTAHHCADGSYTCSDCGQFVPAGEKHSHPHIGTGETYTCDICGRDYPVGSQHGHPFMGADSVCPDCGVTVPAGEAHSHEICTLPLAPSDAPDTYVCEVCGQTVPNGAEHSHGTEHHGEDHHSGHH